MDFASRLKLVRALRGMKQTTLARLVGVHEITVSRWERGRACPTLRQQIRLCEELGVSLDELGVAKATAIRPEVSLAPASVSAAAAEDESDVRRREFLRGAIAFGGALTFAPIELEQVIAVMRMPHMATT